MIQNTRFSPHIFSIFCPTYRHFLTTLQQTTFGNIVTNGEISHSEQYHLFFTMCLTLYLILMLSFKVISICLSRSYNSRLLQICCMSQRVFKDIFLGHAYPFYSRVAYAISEISREGNTLSVLMVFSFTCIFENQNIRLASLVVD